MLTAVVLTPRLGPALYFGLLVAGQLLASLLLEHFGALGLDAHPVSLGRVAGAILLITGAALIRGN